jgi:hypothetical protein
MAGTIIAAVGAAIALATLGRGVIELRAQGRQRRAEYFLKMIERFFSDDRYLRITVLLDAEDEASMGRVSWGERREFLGFVEEVALLVNSKLISPEIAYYMFGYYPILATKSKAFMRDINADSPYWTLFFAFVKQMQELEASPPGHQKLHF